MKVEGGLVIKDFHKIEINNLQIGQKYSFSVATEDEDGNLSEWVKASVFTGNIRDAKIFHTPVTAVCSYLTVRIKHFYFK